MEWKLLAMGLVLSLSLTLAHWLVFVYHKNVDCHMETKKYVSVSFVLTFAMLFMAHWFFGELYVSCQPNAVHRQYNLLWCKN